MHSIHCLWLYGIGQLTGRKKFCNHAFTTFHLKLHESRYIPKKFSQSECWNLLLRIHELVFLISCMGFLYAPSHRDTDIFVRHQLWSTGWNENEIRQIHQIERYIETVRGSERGKIKWQRSRIRKGDEKESPFLTQNTKVNKELKIRTVHPIISDSPIMEDNYSYVIPLRCILPFCKD